MLNQSKIRQMLFLVLLGITILLGVAIVQLYLIVQSGYGDNAAFLALTVITVIILGLMCKGIQYAAALEKAVKSTSLSNHQSAITAKPVTTRIFGQELSQSSQGRFESEILETEKNCNGQGKVFDIGDQPHKRCGKRSRFSISKITKAVLMWERRDPQFASLTLTEFLEQEFGSGPDGVLLMAPTTFYDWRRRVLRDLDAKSKNQSTIKE
jgi:hypothetical protein